MKKQVLTILFAVFTAIGMAQTATDFTANDCSGTSHNLFTELNAGKVIVLCWVMPCGACTGGALTSYNVVQSYASSNPNTVYMYLCDDYANTACASLNSWANSNGLTNALRFSNASINMTNYGSTGMPKVVVLGGANHTVFYNANNTINATNLQNAINSALNATGVDDLNSTVSSFNVLPNPVNNTAEIKFNLVRSSEVDIELFNLEGQVLKNIYSGKLSAGENKIQLDVSGFASGMYLVKLSDGDKNKFINLMVSH